MPNLCYLRRGLCHNKIPHQLNVAIQTLAICCSALPRTGSCFCGLSLEAFCSLLGNTETCVPQNLLGSHIRHLNLLREIDTTPWSDTQILCLPTICR